MEFMMRELASSETPKGTLSLRCRLVQGDFFAMAGADGFSPDQPRRTVDAILLDVDHSPRWTLHPSHAWLYDRMGLSRLADYINLGGVFVLCGRTIHPMKRSATTSLLFL